jgi:uncharacterized protein YhfF
MNTNNNPTTEQFWQQFLTCKDLDADTKHTGSWHFEVSEKGADSLLALVLSGQKRATASILKAYELEGSRVPEVGDYSIITDFHGTPHCIIQTTAITIIPFNEMTFDICKREGEDDRLKTWQDGHRRFFTHELKALGHDFTEDMPVVFEDFAVVYGLQEH